MVSVASVAPDGAVSGQIAHGHWPPTSNALLVMNVYVSVVIVWPNWSVAPLTVTV